MQRFGLELHKGTLDQLSVSAKLVLAAASAERHSDIYEKFVRCSNARRSGNFDEILETIWREASHPELSQEELELLQRRAMRHVPGKQAKPSQYNEYAEFALLSLIHCIRVRLYGESSDVIYAAHQAFVSIWTFLTTPIGGAVQINMIDPGAVAQFESHYLVEAEHIRQERDLNDVRDIASKQSSMIEIAESLKTRSKMESKLLIPIV